MPWTGDQNEQGENRNRPGECCHSLHSLSAAYSSCLCCHGFLAKTLYPYPGNQNKCLKLLLVGWSQYHEVTKQTLAGSQYCSLLDESNEGRLGRESVHGCRWVCSRQVSGCFSLGASYPQVSFCLVHKSQHKKAGVAFHQPPVQPPLCLLEKSVVWVQPVLDTVRLSCESPFFKLYQKTMWCFSHRPTVGNGSCWAAEIYVVGKSYMKRYCCPVSEMMINAAVACFLPICFCNLVWQTCHICHWQNEINSYLWFWRRINHQRIISKHSGKGYADLQCWSQAQMWWGSAIPILSPLPGQLIKAQ